MYSGVNRSAEWGPGEIMRTRMRIWLARNDSLILRSRNIEGMFHDYQITWAPSSVVSFLYSAPWSNLRIHQSPIVRYPAYTVQCEYFSCEW